MWCRKRIDIGWRDLLCGLWWTIRPGRPQQNCDPSAAGPFTSDEAVTALSVRSGFDQLLRSLALPPGSEVIMSAVTIQDMARIIQAHDLVPVPVDLEPSTMLPLADDVEKLITPRTRVMLVAHLFGAIHEVESLVQMAHQHDLLFVEDCAQAFAGAEYPGHPQ